MRAGFGLVGLLICIGVIVWFMYKIELPHDQAVISAGQKAREQVNPIAGYSTDGKILFSDSLSLELQSSGGRSNSLLVTDVMAGGPAQTYFGLVRGDSIVEIGPLSVRDSINSTGEGRDMVMDSYQHHSTLTVVRDGQKITLPHPGATPSTPTPAPAQKKSSDGVQGQLDAIQQMPGH